MQTSSGPLAIACLAAMYALSKSVSLISVQLGTVFATAQLLLIAGFALNCACGYIVLWGFKGR